ncbi:ATP-binding protein [Streptomyces flaveolus]|uniref:ATP-binding protein n=1 Tax=Streptomyces flaveolus TaxID=67297 RepID=UPI0036FE28B0
MTSPGISAREAEVLALLGEHLSNAEMAARLVLSVRTVESHVSSLLRKLHLPDRRALARHAAEVARAERSRSAPALPAPLTAFIGRVRERGELAEAVKAHRLVTVTGPGGVGKTRLALAVAAEVAGDFADGVWFVDLVPVTEPDRVGAAVAAAVGVGEQPGRGIDDAVLAALADHRALLVLDNCEQVRDGVAPFLERLLAACPGLRVLVTSRARLMVPFERVLPVPPLSRDGGDASEAVALFTDRAAAVGQSPGPAVSDGVVAVCERLGGVALAIELAAARWSTLGLDGLTAGLSDPLRILTGGPRADDRHRSLRAVLDWSHDLLDPWDQALLRRVSVFVTPFTAEAATEVAGFTVAASAGVPGCTTEAGAEAAGIAAEVGAGSTGSTAEQAARSAGLAAGAGTGVTGPAADPTAKATRFTAGRATGATGPAADVATEATGATRPTAGQATEPAVGPATEATGRATGVTGPAAEATRPTAAPTTKATRPTAGQATEATEPAAGAATEATGPTAAPTTEVPGFTAGAGAGVTGCIAHAVGSVPLGPAAVVDGLGRLAEQSLLAVTPSAAGTRYQALETIRQYGTERLVDAGELTDVRARHLTWCLAAATPLEDTSGADWRARFDALADDLRAALAWAAGRPERRADAHRLALSLAGLAFSRTLLGEAQQRYEQAAALAGDAAAAAALRQAAAVAGCRRLGDDMYRLHRAAAQAARRAGDRAGACRDLAAAATVAYRFSTLFTRIPPVAEVTALLAEARELADGTPAAEAAVALAEAAVLCDAYGALQGAAENTVDDTVVRAEQAVALARRTGDPVAESAALDALSGARSWAGDAFAGAAAARRRVGILASLAPAPARTHESMDALAMAAGTALGVGALPDARRWGGQLADHPLLAEAGHHATAWLLAADAFAGHGDKVLGRSTRFLDAWEHSGRRPSLSLGAAAASVAMVHGLRGEHDERASWLTVVDQADTAPEQHRLGYGAVLDGMVLLHHGDAEAALERLAPDPGEVWKWVCWIWLHWYVALRAEAAVLAGHPEARARVDAARTAVAGNPVATAQVDRARALLDGDLPGQLAAAAAFDAAGCPYQSARTLLLAGGEHTAAGEAALAGLGLAARPRR